MKNVTQEGIACKRRMNARALLLRSSTGARTPGVKLWKKEQATKETKTATCPVRGGKFAPMGGKKSCTFFWQGPPPLFLLTRKEQTTGGKHGPDQDGRKLFLEGPISKYLPTLSKQRKPERKKLVQKLCSAREIRLPPDPNFKENREGIRMRDPNRRHLSTGRNQQIGPKKKKIKETTQPQLERRTRVQNKSTGYRGQDKKKRKKWGVGIVLSQTRGKEKENESQGNKKQSQEKKKTKDNESGMSNHTRLKKGEGRRQRSVGYGKHAIPTGNRGT